jgi:glycosyltransferase involved in cell wall biosynthesis
MPNKTCILIPHYNDFIGLLNTVSSISANESVDLLIVDDGSTKTLIEEDALRSHLKFNGELIIIYLKQNQGIEGALNTGLRYIAGKKYLFVARLDAGDLALEDRFRHQEDYMLGNPDIYLSGTFCRYADLSGKVIFDCKPETTHSNIRKKYFLSVMHIHPTVIFRTEVISLIGLYPTNYPAAEDYAYFFSIAKSLKTSNIPTVYTIKVVDPDSISEKNRKKQQFSRLRIIIKYFDFSWLAFLGLARSITLLAIPKSFTKWLKSMGWTGY